MCMFQKFRLLFDIKYYFNCFKYIYILSFFLIVRIFVTKQVILILLYYMQLDNKKINRIILCCHIDSTCDCIPYTKCYVLYLITILFYNITFTCTISQRRANKQGPKMQEKEKNEYIWISSFSNEMENVTLIRR